jgi:hypothetical protein
MAPNQRREIPSMTSPTNPSAVAAGNKAADGSPPRELNKMQAVVANAATDPAFRARLLADPAAALAELGLAPRAGVSIKVVECTEDTLYLTLPPAGWMTGRLDERALDQVSGGFLQFLGGGWGGELFDEMIDGNLYGSSSSISNVNSGNWNLITIGSININYGS